MSNVIGKTTQKIIITLETYDDGNVKQQITTENISPIGVIGFFEMQRVRNLTFCIKEYSNNPYELESWKEKFIAGDLTEMEIVGYCEFMRMKIIFERENRTKVTNISENVDSIVKSA